MAHSEVCPICKGKGTVVKDVGGGIGKEDLPCHGCSGKGWITIQDGNIQWYPSYPVYPQPIYPHYPYITYTCGASNMCKKEV